MPYLSASAVVIHYEEALYQVYGPLPFTFRVYTGRPYLVTDARVSMNFSGSLPESEGVRNRTCNLLTASPSPNPVSITSMAMPSLRLVRFRLETEVDQVKVGLLSHFIQFKPMLK